MVPLTLRSIYHSPLDAWGSCHNHTPFCSLCGLYCASSYRHNSRKMRSLVSKVESRGKTSSMWRKYTQSSSAFMHLRCSSDQHRQGPQSWTSDILIGREDRREIQSRKGIKKKQANNTLWWALPAQICHGPHQVMTEGKVQQQPTHNRAPGHLTLFHFSKSTSLIGRGMSCLLSQWWRVPYKWHDLFL